MLWLLQRCRPSKIHIEHEESGDARDQLRTQGLCTCWPRSISPRRALVVLSVCSLFMVIGPSLVILNKYILQTLGFPYPLSLSCLGLLTSAMATRCLVWLGLASVRSESLDVVSGCNWYRIALPIGFCKAMTLASGNAVYLHLGLGFIQMLKAFSPAVILVTMKLFGVATPSTSAVGCVFVIVAGTLFEVRGNMDASLIGLFLMLLSQVTEAIDLVMTQRLLQNNKFTIVEGLYLLAGPGAAFLLLLAAVLEWPRLLREGDLQKVAEFRHCFAAAASIGCAVTLVGFLLIQATSSLTVKILSGVRCIGLVVVSVVFYGETCSLMETCGYAISMVGFAGYNYVQTQSVPRSRVSASDACSFEDVPSSRKNGSSTLPPIVTEREQAV